MRWRNPVPFHLLISLSLCVAGTVACWWFLTRHQQTWRVWLANWLFVVNLVTFLYYGFDKFRSNRSAGGSPKRSFTPSAPWAAARPRSLRCGFFATRP